MCRLPKVMTAPQLRGRGSEVGSGTGSSVALVKDAELGNFRNCDRNVSVSSSQ